MTDLDPVVLEVFSEVFSPELADRLTTAQLDKFMQMTLQLALNTVVENQGVDFAMAFIASSLSVESKAVIQKRQLVG